MTSRISESYKVELLRLKKEKRKADKANGMTVRRAQAEFKHKAVAGITAVAKWLFGV